MGDQEPLYFSKARQSGRIVVDGQPSACILPDSSTQKLTLKSEPPKLDLDAYVANYKGKLAGEEVMDCLRDPDCLQVGRALSVCTLSEQHRPTSISMH